MPSDLPAHRWRELPPNPFVIDAAQRLRQIRIRPSAIEAIRLPPILIGCTAIVNIAAGPADDSTSSATDDAKPLPIYGSDIDTPPRKKPRRRRKRWQGRRDDSTGQDG